MPLSLQLMYVGDRKEHIKGRSGTTLNTEEGVSESRQRHSAAGKEAPPLIHIPGSESLCGSQPKAAR